jgi:hypothetical protein
MHRCCCYTPVHCVVYPNTSVFSCHFPLILLLLTVCRHGPRLQRPCWLIIRYRRYRGIRNHSPSPLQPLSRSPLLSLGLFDKPYRKRLPLDPRLIHLSNFPFPFFFSSSFRLLDGDGDSRICRIGEEESRDYTVYQLYVFP